jgi:signal transduction histidine kinase
MPACSRTIVSIFKMGESWPDTKRESLDALYRVGVQLADAADLVELKERIVHSVIQLIGARRVGLIELATPVRAWGEVTIRVADEGTMAAEFSGEDRFLISEMIAESIATGRRAVKGNLSDDDLPETIDLHTVAVAPLRARNETLAALYAENSDGGFDGTDLILFETLALLAASRLETIRLHEALLTADREMSDYVSRATHEMRTPLTSISGYTDLLLSNVGGSLDDQQMKFLNRIKRNVDRMSVLVRDLSDINRLESGRMQLELESFDISEMVSPVVNSLALAFGSREQEIIVDVGADAPAVCADLSGVRRVLNNLLDNASRYTPQGGKIVVRVLQDGHFARIEVGDTGIGISEDDQSNLFTPFFRSEESAVREQVGWGLGLVVARKLVEAQGGEITWTSESGQGSTFAFTLPLAGKGIC